MHSFKSFALSLIILAFSAQTLAYTAFLPILGHSPDDEVTVDSVGKIPKGGFCGGIEYKTSDLKDDSQLIKPGKDGIYTIKAQNFKIELAGSREIQKILVSETGEPTESSFKTTEKTLIVKNGVREPPTLDTEDLQIKLPSNFKCSAGNGNVCVLQINTPAGFGNCVGLVQGSSKGSGSADKSADADATATGNAVTADTGNADTADTGSADNDDAKAKKPTPKKPTSEKPTPEKPTPKKAPSSRLKELLKGRRSEDFNTVMKRSRFIRKRVAQTSHTA